jgi:glycerol uptake facilitator protein
MSIFLAEFFSTAILILFGNGVVANVLLAKTKGQNSGLIVIAFGWAIAVFTAVFISASYSGAHLNPAISLAFALEGRLGWSMLSTYWTAQFGGAMLGQLLVWLSYRNHYVETEDALSIRASFCTSPAIRDLPQNFLSELIATFVLVTGVFFIASPAQSLGALDALPVALLVLGIGVSLGGTTGYAINPARDLGPRIVHTFLPMENKTDSDWKYAWVPLLGPLSGAALSALFYSFVSA